MTKPDRLFNNYQVRAQALALLRYYDEHGRDFPWRRTACPPHIAVLAESLLLSMAPEVLAPVFEGVFRGVKTYQQWLDLPKEEKQARFLEARLPECRVVELDHTAKGCVEGRTTNSALAFLRGGFDARQSPVDAHAARVASRVETEAISWVRALLGAAGDLPANLRVPPRYRLAAALTDIGEAVCTPKKTECAACPLTRWCPRGRRAAAAGADRVCSACGGVRAQRARGTTCAECKSARRWERDNASPYRTLRHAIFAAGASSLAAALGIAPTVVRGWLRSRIVPEHMLAAVEAFAEKTRDIEQIRGEGFRYAPFIVETLHPDPEETTWSGYREGV